MLLRRRTRARVDVLNVTAALAPGQRFISDSEPELGLGSIESVGRLTLTLRFGASGETREYAKDNAPLRRVRFHPGDRIRDRGGASQTVRAVFERRDLLVYVVEGDREVPETDLDDALSFSKPEERLFVGQVDTPEAFDLRADALAHRHRALGSEVRGFVGARIDLIPHQLSIAATTSERLAPRVLLADEVGLGKTIEACLILHRLLLTGRVSRALIVTPDSLVHQWLVELVRRFNLWPKVYDEARCSSIEATRPDANPFLEDQIVLSPLSLFTDSERRTRQAAEARWDVIVVDEAHHLEWSELSASPAYRAIETLARSSTGLMLLTATPEQLGAVSHFARLRLLDPARFPSLQAFERESEGYRAVATQAATVTDPAALAKLIDRHGTSRVMFRNTRATVRGFKRRTLEQHRLRADAVSPEVIERLRDEFRSDAIVTGARGSSEFAIDLTGDPRVPWLLDLVSALEPAKILVIGTTRAKAEALATTLRDRANLKVAAFHEGLTLLQRDRHAAWFAEEDGARVLVCSEIGSEGRNFQFARHLVMFDLPIEPEVLEQRIGRLDRIGQAGDVTIHVPFVPGTPQEIAARWYHEGLNAFESSVSGGHELGTRFRDDLVSLATASRDAAFEDRVNALIRNTAEARVALAGRLEAGRDRLLELGSLEPAVAERVVAGVRNQDADLALDDFMIRALESFTIQVEEIAPRTYQLGSSGVLTDTFPGLRESGLTLTCDRARALTREDIQFLTWDHPLVTAALDLLLGAEKGNCALAFWPDVKAAGLYLETIHVLECVAPRSLHTDRFLPPTPLRAVFDHTGRDVTGKVPPSLLRGRLERTDSAMVQMQSIREDIVPRLLGLAERRAGESAKTVVDAALRDARLRLDAEIHRLRELREVNPAVRPEEIDLLATQRNDLEEAIGGARVRLDAIRLIRRGSE